MQKVGVTQDLFRILGLGPAFNGPFMKWIELGCHGVSHCSPQRSMPHSTKAGQEMEVKEDVRRKEWGGGTTKEAEEEEPPTVEEKLKASFFNA